MKYYQVTKVDSTTGNAINYGQNSEPDMKLITRGYKQDELIPEFYNRKGSKYFFIATEIE